jgi:hypothetical protein
MSKELSVRYLQRAAIAGAPIHLHHAYVNDASGSRG